MSDTTGKHPSVDERRAWEREHEMMSRAVPVLRTHEEQTWDAVEAIEEQKNTLAKMMWLSHVPGSGAPERLMVAAVQALENRGLVVPSWRELVEEGLAALEADDVPRLIRAHTALSAALAHAEKDPASPYWRYTAYDTWEAFEAAASFDRLSGAPYRESAERYHARTYAAWVAQIAGGALGTSIEGYTGAALKKAYGEISGYLAPPSTYNDDITFEIAFLKAVERAGTDISAREIGFQWVALIPFGWSAELIALRNLEAGILPPESGRFHNPFSEWIGAQMRGVVCGMVAPGSPREAARLAWMDGSVSHTNNGIIGEVFNAVMASCAYVQSDVRTIVADAVAMLPADSEYASVVSFALERCRAESSWETAWSACEEQYVRYNWVHAYPNACAEVVALWFGNGDFDTTMKIIAMAGQDVDCNAAQIMTVLVLARSAEDTQADPLAVIPAAWRDPIGEELDTYVRTMKKLSIRELTELTQRGAELLGTTFA